MSSDVLSTAWSALLGISLVWYFSVKAVLDSRAIEEAAAVQRKLLAIARAAGAKSPESTVAGWVSKLEADGVEFVSRFSACALLRTIQSFGCGLLLGLIGVMFAAVVVHLQKPPTGSACEQAVNILTIISLVWSALAAAAWVIVGWFFGGTRALCDMADPRRWLR